MIYYTTLSEQLACEDYERIYMDIFPFLPEFRKKKAQSIIPSKERALSALSFILLCHALANEYPHRFQGHDLASIGNMLNFTYSENGKPSLNEPYNDIFFNISHCRTAIACAVAPYDVGMDIQDIRHPSPAILRRIPHSMNKDEFSSFWSRYEAYTKLTGEGITKSFADCDYMSKAFLWHENVTVTTTAILYEKELCEESHSNKQKKTAAYLSAAFYNDCYYNNHHIDSNDISANSTLSCSDVTAALSKACLHSMDNFLVSVRLSDLCRAVLL